MDGVHSLAATDVVVTLGGTKVRLAPLRLLDFATIERHLLDERPDPLAVVLANLDRIAEPLQRHLLELAYDDLRRGPRVARAELLDWLETHTGQVYRLWLALRRDEPGRTLPDVERLLVEATPAEEVALLRALDLVAGDPRGN